MSKINSSLYFMKAASAVSPTNAAAEARWTPNTDVYVSDEGLVIKVELAGIRREDLEITVEGARLMINGQRPDCCRGPNCRFLMMEINYGHFESIIELPSGYELGKAKASYQNGFLRIDVPQSAVAPVNVTVLEAREK
ncbi:MAG: Hsp20/alpha crystallin family protein [Verrucomicrobia bacterium]|nr:Hsp20/alpha crystallin family protein [Verrucomicrobiota bacterium]